MSKDELEILKKHAKESGAMPVYMYKDGRNNYVWLDVSTGFSLGTMKSYTKEWYRNRMKIRKQLREMKKKNVAEYNKYVLKNWKEVKEFIC